MIKFIKYCLIIILISAIITNLQIDYFFKLTMSLCSGSLIAIIFLESLNE